MDSPALPGIELQRSLVSLLHPFWDAITVLCDLRGWPGVWLRKGLVPAQALTQRRIGSCGSNKGAAHCLCGWPLCSPVDQVDLHLCFGKPFGCLRGPSALSGVFENCIRPAHLAESVVRRKFKPVLSYMISRDCSSLFRIRLVLPKSRSSIKASSGSNVLQGLSCRTQVRNVGSSFR